MTDSTNDPFRFTTIAHATHQHCCPLSDAKAERLLGLVAHSGAARPDGRILDVGCGKGTLLLEAIRRLGCRGVGVDPNPEFIRAAAHAAKETGLVDRVELLAHRIADASLPKRAFDAVFCIGATHAFGGYRFGLSTLAEFVRPGGVLLIGEGFWRKQPDPAYLAVLGAQPDDYACHAENEAFGQSAGLVPLYACASSDDEWEHYEGLYLANVERHVADRPDDPDAPAFRDRIRRWRDAYRRYGRDTLGFGFYLFRAPT